MDFIFQQLGLYKPLQLARTEEVFKANVYFKGTFYLITRSKRSAYWRRKHLSNWTPYFNFLVYWAMDYGYQKKVSASVVGATRMRYKYQGFNLLRVSSWTPVLGQGFYNFLVTAHFPLYSTPYTPFKRNNFFHFPTTFLTFLSKTSRLFVKEQTNLPESLAPLLTSIDAFYAPVLTSMGFSGFQFSGFLLLKALAFCKIWYRLMTLLLLPLLTKKCP